MKLMLTCILAAGKWSARKAQLLAKRYKAAIGGYK